MKAFPVKVQGQANKKVTPDQVQITAYISVDEKSRQAALEKALTIRTGVIKELKAKFSDCERTSTGVSVWEKTRYNIGNKRVSDGYTASAQVTVIADADKAQSLFALMAAQEEVNVHNPRFIISRDLHDKTQMELIAQAISHAKTQATAMAEACDAKIEGILSIGEENGHSYAYQEMDAFAAPASAMRVFAQSESYSQEERLEELLGELKPTPVEQSRQVLMRYELSALDR